MSFITGNSLPGALKPAEMYPFAAEPAGRTSSYAPDHPPPADDVVARVGDLRRRLERGRVHHAPAPENHPVGLDLADLQPLRLLLVARMRHGDGGELIAVLLGPV